MSLSPLWAAPAPIPLHALAALAAFALGALQLALPKGTARHRVMGWAWVGSMAVVALSSFAISEIGTFGYFSAIHVLSVVTLISLTQGVAQARRHRARLHGATMGWLFVGALLIAGAFTFTPYRVMNDVVTGRDLAAQARAHRAEDRAEDRAGDRAP